MRSISNARRLKKNLERKAAFGQTGGGVSAIGGKSELKSTEAARKFKETARATHIFA